MARGSQSRIPQRGYRPALRQEDDGAGDGKQQEDSCHAVQKVPRALVLVDVQQEEAHGDLGRGAAEQVGRDGEHVVLGRLDDLLGRQGGFVPAEAVVDGYCFECDAQCC